MLVPTPPMSNAERQRLFQAHHPGYDRRRKARQRAMAMRGAEQLLAAVAVQAAPAEAPPQPLMLPAPAEHPLLAELNAQAASLTSGDYRVGRSVPMPMPMPATAPAGEGTK